MKRLIQDTIEQRIYGMSFPGHEGRIQRLEKLAQTLNLPWGAIEATLVSVSSGTTFSTVNLLLGGNTTGATDGSGAITISGSGNGGLILNQAGVYLIATHTTATTTGSPAANSVLEITSTFAGNKPLAGRTGDGGYKDAAGTATHYGAGELALFNADPTVVTIPFGPGTTQLRQNTGLTLFCNVWVIAIDISSVTGANFS